MTGMDSLVLGSPGSGKTNLIKKLVSKFETGGLDPSEVLVVTPQRTAATRLRGPTGSQLKKSSDLAKSTINYFLGL